MRRDCNSPQGVARYLTTPENVKVRFESRTQEALDDALTSLDAALTSGAFLGLVVVVALSGVDGANLFKVRRRCNSASVHFRLLFSRPALHESYRPQHLDQGFAPDFFNSPTTPDLLRKGCLMYDRKLSSPWPVPSFSHKRSTSCGLELSVAESA
jgi:hypothetical protein